MKNRDETEIERFENFARGIVNVSRSAIQKKLEEEKDAKQQSRRKKKSSRVANG